MRVLSDRGNTHVVLPVLISVLIASGCVLWFMNRAMTNERAAAQDRMGRAYRTSFTAAVKTYHSDWEALIGKLNAIHVDDGGSIPFADGVKLGAAGAVLLDSDGIAVYPRDEVEVIADTSRFTDRWVLARALEFQFRDFAEAAKTFAWLSREETAPSLRAQAHLGHARCLTKMGQPDAAFEILAGTLQDSEFRNTTDDQARLIAPNALALALKAVEDPQPTIQQLITILNDYTLSRFPSSQRVFLMRHLVESWDLNPNVFPTFAAEALTARFMRSERASTESILGMTFGDWIQARTSREGFGFAVSTNDSVWWVRAENGRAIYLFDQVSIQTLFAQAAGDLFQETDFHLKLTTDGSVPDDAFAAASVFGSLPGWSITLHLRDPGQFDAAAADQLVVYVWAGAFSILIMVTAGGLTARSIGRQACIARLKNDLAATVSHELKTPIASVKVLVDTLLEAPPDTDRTGEYLALISRENERLERLGGNFLAYSKIEQNSAYDAVPCDPVEIVHAAIDPLRDRLDADGFHAELLVDDTVPNVIADRNALITAVSNLLENAYKFSKDSRRIKIRVVAEESEIHFSVTDEGVGMTRRESKRVFDRFYQVDTRLSRESSGVGLGHSIVEGIVEAHGGAVSVES